MTQHLAAAWLLQHALGYIGPAVAWLGVATFGWFFIRINARAAQGETAGIPLASWHGRGANIGLGIFALGLVLAAASVILLKTLPGRY